MHLLPCQEKIRLLNIAYETVTNPIKCRTHGTRVPAVACPMPIASP